MNRQIVVVVLALVLVGGAAFLFGRTSAPGQGTVSTPTIERTVDAARPARGAIEDAPAGRTQLARPMVPDAAAGGVAPPPPVPPLPPHDLPLAQIRAELEERARAGDRRAACRLAVDLIRCQDLPTMRSMSSTMERSLARDDAAREATQVGFRIDFLARTQNRLEELEPLCAGITEADTVRGFDWLLRAAELGHTPSMAEFARRPAMPFQSYLAELDRLRVYRDRAPEMAMRALAAGDASLLPELAAAHLDSGRMGISPLGQLVEKDDATAYAYFALMQRLAPATATPSPPPEPRRGRGGRGGGRRGGGGPDAQWLPRVMEGVSAEDRARGEALANDWEQRYFAQSTEPPRLAPPDGRPDPALCDKD